MSSTAIMSEKNTVRSTSSTAIMSEKNTVRSTFVQVSRRFTLEGDEFVVHMNGVAGEVPKITFMEPGNGGSSMSVLNMPVTVFQEVNAWISENMPKFSK